MTLSCFRKSKNFVSSNCLNKIEHRYLFSDIIRGHGIANLHFITDVKKFDLFDPIDRYSIGK